MSVQLFFFLLLLFSPKLVALAYMECLRAVVSCLNVSLNYLNSICIFLPLKLVQQCYTICVNLWSVRYLLRHFVLLALWVFVMSVNFGFDILHQLKTLLIVHCCICCFLFKEETKKDESSKHILWNTLYCSDPGWSAIQFTHNLKRQHSCYQIDMDPLTCTVHGSSFCLVHISPITWRHFRPVGLVHGKCGTEGTHQRKISQLWNEVQKWIHQKLLLQVWDYV